MDPKTIMPYDVGCVPAGTLQVEESLFSAFVQAKNGRFDYLSKHCI